MKDCQKVYIKGNPNRGAEVIKALTDLGGVNSWSYAGTDEKALYYINSRGNIENIYDYEFSSKYVLVKEFYKEITLPERKNWKPEYKDCYYHINAIGDVIRSIWANSQMDKLCLEFGNCFRTKEEAEAAKYKIKEMLNTK